MFKIQIVKKKNNPKIHKQMGDVCKPSKFFRRKFQLLTAGETEPDAKFRFPAEIHCTVGCGIYIGVGGPTET